VQSTISDLERGHGASLSVDLWQRVFVALDRNRRLETTRDRLKEPADAGQLAIQELILRLARRAGRHGTFELATKPIEPWRSTDVGIRDDRHRALILVECWNTIGDIGAAARSTTRKMAEAEQLATVIGGEKPYRVASCWVVRASARNRELLARYPEVFAAKFRGSSFAWVKALDSAEAPPREIGLVWSDPMATRVFPWRKRLTR
jgi:hypothetical protein